MFAKKRILFEQINSKLTYKNALFSLFSTAAVKDVSFFLKVEQSKTRILSDNQPFNKI